MMTSNYLKSELREAPEIAIVELTAEVWDFHGYETEIRPDSSGDDVDIIATQSQPYQRTEAIHVAHTPGQEVEGTLLQQVSDLPTQEDTDSVILVVTGQVREGVRSLANDMDVKLVDTEQLCSMIDKADLYSKVADAIDLNVSRDNRIRVESVVDRIVRNTPTKAKQSLRESLRSYFEKHPSVDSVETQSTLTAFSDDENGGWQESAIVRFSPNPELDADSVATHLMKELDDSQLGPVEPSVLSFVISLQLETTIGTPLENASESEVAKWLVNDYNEENVPLIGTDAGLAVDIAEDMINTDDSVATNKLRVAERLNRRYSEEFDPN